MRDSDMRRSVKLCDSDMWRRVKMRDSDMRRRVKMRDPQARVVFSDFIKCVIIFTFSSICVAFRCRLL